MPTSSLSGFIGKKQATQQYNRSHRQLTREISNAIKAGDTKYLANFKLRTEDDVHDGANVTIELIDELRINGHNPMWYIREDWIRDTYGLKDESSQPQTDKGTPHTAPAEGEPASSEMNDMYIELLHSQIADLKQDKIGLLDELKERNKQFEQFNTLLQNNQRLTQELHVMLRHTQETLIQSFSVVPVLHPAVPLLP